MRRLDGITDGHVHTMDMSLSKLRETVQDGGVAESDKAERLNKMTRQSEAVSEGLWGPLLSWAWLCTAVLAMPPLVPTLRWGSHQVD